MVLNWAVEEYDFAEMRKRKGELKKRVLEEHSGLQMRQHIGELTALYDLVGARKDQVLKDV